MNNDQKTPAKIESSSQPASSPQHTREFKTHIKEPRWQSVVSVIVIAAIIIFWLIEQF